MARWSLPGDNTNNDIQIDFNGATFRSPILGRTNAISALRRHRRRDRRLSARTLGATQVRIAVLDANLGAGDDILTNNTQFGTARQDYFGGTYGFQGGHGDDRIFGGSAEEHIFGGRGDDRLEGGGGDDQLFDGSALDANSFNFDEDPNGQDTLIGGAGKDTARYDNRIDRTQILLDGLANDGSVVQGENDNVQTENVVGGRASDLIVGDSAPNRISGNLGNDTLRGGAGGDTLNGEDGSDFLVGDRGKDRLIGGDEDDVLLTAFDGFRDKSDCGAGDGDQALADAGRWR